VHVHNTFPLLSPSVLHACREAGVPVVATIHNSRLVCAKGDYFRDGAACHACADGSSWPALRHGCYRGSRLATAPVVAANVLHRQAWQELVSAYVFVSAAHRDLMGALSLPPERVFVKPNFVDAPAPSAVARRRVVTFVGRLDAVKGIPLLMRAWDSFLERVPTPGLRLRIVGDGPLRSELARWAADRTGVELVGLVDRSTVASLLAESLACVLASEGEETFGLVAVEAMAARVAPIAPTRGAFPELFRDGLDGVLYPAGDHEALAGVLAEVEASPEGFLEMGERARATYERRFTREANLAQLAEVYEYAVAHPAGRRSADPAATVPDTGRETWTNR
jgi:glycosyltransferase involved in cell wall biosynthesis